MAIEFIRNLITSGYNVSKINDNFQKIQVALLDALSRSGGTPNVMNADIDMNNHDLMNIHTIDATNFSFEGVDFEGLIEEAEASAIASAASASAASTSASNAATSATNANNSAIAAAASAATASSAAVTVITTATQDNTFDDTDNLSYSTGGTVKRGTLTGLISSVWNGTRVVANILANASSFRIADGTDTTKRIGFNAASISTGTVRTITMPNADVDLGFLDVKAWVDFNGTGTPAIKASKNVSSITDNAVGDWTINFTTALVDTNFAVVGSSVTSTQIRNLVYTTKATNNVRIQLYNTGASLVDETDISVVIMR